MLKYIVTTKCERKCSYCISKNVQSKECESLRKLEKVFKELSRSHKSIMFTGGEPTESKFLVRKVDLAKQYFYDVYLSSSNELVTKRPMYKNLFAAITFGIHEPVRAANIFIENKARIYGAVLADNFYPMLPYELQSAGFAGLTVNENHRTGSPYRPVKDDRSLAKPFDIMRLPVLPDFSYRVNRKGTCITGETIILPDLTIINDFTPYL